MMNETHTNIQNGIHPILSCQSKRDEETRQASTMQMQFADAQHIIVNTATEAAQRSRARATCAGSGSAGEVQQFCAILLKTQPQSRCDMKKKRIKKRTKHHTFDKINPYLYVKQSNLIFTILSYESTASNE